MLSEGSNRDEQAALVTIPVAADAQPSEREEEDPAKKKNQKEKKRALRREGTPRAGRSSGR